MNQTSEPNPFWDFSLSQYDNPEVAKRCLSLQDNYGLSVNMLFYSLWLATRHKRLDMTPLAQQQALRQCREEVLAPLRSARYAMKRIGMSVGRPRLYSDLKQLELEVENIEQKLLFRLTQSMPDATLAQRPLAQQNLTVYWYSVRPQSEPLPPEAEQLLQLVLGDREENVFFTGNRE